MHSPVFYSLSLVHRKYIYKVGSGFRTSGYWSIKKLDSPIRMLRLKDTLYPDIILSGYQIISTTCFDIRTASISGHTKVQILKLFGHALISGHSITVHLITRHLITRHSISGHSISGIFDVQIPSFTKLCIVVRKPGYHCLETIY